MLYLDANVFVHAVLDSGPKGARAADLLRTVAAGEAVAFTSTLTWDEVVWTMMGEVDRTVALEQGNRLLSLPNLRILGVGREEILLASRLMEDHRALDPRDAIHAATAIRAGATALVTDDDKLPALKEIKRQGL
jgi:predicted nucleic acid-binding protein